MNVLILDVETTISNKGNPFDLTNKLVCVGLKWKDQLYIEYDHFDTIQKYIDFGYILVGFNIKFDLHWLRRIGIDISKIRVWDCQVAEFILNNQQTKYPSLDEAALKYGYPPKIDNIKLNYWDKGICTSKVPRDELSDYLTQDLLLTEQVFKIQYKQFTGKSYV